MLRLSLCFGYLCALAIASHGSVAQERRIGKSLGETMENLFPVNLNLHGRKCLVVGGGRVAERKVKSLLQCGAEIWIVSPELTGELEELTQAFGKSLSKNRGMGASSSAFGKSLSKREDGQGTVNLIDRCYDPEDLQDCFLVISAADDPLVNSRVAEDCFARNIPVNTVDDPARCSFTVPSILRRGSLCIAVSTGGNSPLLARKIREGMENLFGPEYARFLELMGEIRNQVIRDIPDSKKRRRVFECLINSDILELVRKSEELRSMGNDQNSKQAARSTENEQAERSTEEDLDSELSALADLIEKRIALCMSLKDRPET